MENYNLDKNELVNNAKAIIDNSLPLISNLSSLACLIKESFTNASWAGFYLYDKDNKRLVIGPYQGSVACVEIKMGRGVCGTSAIKKETVIVPDVNKFVGHIACSSSTKSEIVVPIYDDTNLYGVIDLDSNDYDSFDNNDASILENLASLMITLWK